MVANVTCRKLDLQPVPFASALARPRAGSSRPAKIAMMAITTSSSMSVNALLQRNGFFIAGHYPRPKALDRQRRTRSKTIGAMGSKLRRMPAENLRLGGADASFLSFSSHKEERVGERRPLGTPLSGSLPA